MIWPAQWKPHSLILALSAATLVAIAVADGEIAAGKTHD